MTLPSSIKAALVRLIDQYLRGLMEPEVTLLEVHKLSYFLQQAGLPMRLRFAKGHYGPYAENLRHVLREMEGCHLAGYGDGGDQPDKRIEIVPGALEAAEQVLAGDEATSAAFDRIARLVEGFETPFGLELLATTHWAMAQEGATTPEAVEAVFRNWNERKSGFTPRQIGIARERLTSQGWLSAAA